MNGLPRGEVLPLTREQQVARMLYLGGKLPIQELDPYVRDHNDTDAILGLDGYKDPDGDGLIMCPDLYYLLEEHNGGKDPRAPDPATRWRKPGSKFVNRTCDCIGGIAWAAGWDRYQPRRFAHIYGGWINTDSMIQDARGAQRCFVTLKRPEPGAYLVYGTVVRDDGTKVPGHIMGITAYNGVEWDPKDVGCYRRIIGVDVSSQGAGKRANNMRTGEIWFPTKARPSYIIRSVMWP